MKERHIWMVGWQEETEITMLYMPESGHLPVVPAGHAKRLRESMTFDQSYYDALLDRLAHRTHERIQSGMDEPDAFLRMMGADGFVCEIAESPTIAHRIVQLSETPVDDAEASAFAEIAPDWFHDARAAGEAMCVLRQDISKRLDQDAS